MTSLGATLGQALHLSPQAAALTGVWFARITGLNKQTHQQTLQPHGVSRHAVGVDFGHHRRPQRFRHLSPQAAALTGVWFARITGLSMFLAYTGAFFTLSYSPVLWLLNTCCQLALTPHSTMASE
jgi:hypothetical protein